MGGLPIVDRTTPQSSNNRALPILGALVLATAAVAIYLPALNGRFILDDDLLLTRNTLVKSSDGLARIWCSTEAVDYWPITNSSFWLEWRCWQTNPIGYHVTNLILHIAISLLLWAVLRKLAIPGACFAALLFTVHPVNVESVAWIAQRKNLLALLWSLVCTWCYLKAQQKRSDGKS